MRSNTSYTAEVRAVVFAVLNVVGVAIILAGSVPFASMERSGNALIHWFSGCLPIPAFGAVIGLALTRVLPPKAKEILVFWRSGPRPVSNYDGILDGAIRKANRFLNRKSPSESAASEGAEGAPAIRLASFDLRAASLAVVNQDYIVHRDQAIVALTFLLSVVVLVPFFADSTILSLASAAVVLFVEYRIMAAIAAHDSARLAAVLLENIR